MLVGDLIYNDEFDCNCNFEIYDCRENDKTWDKAEILWSTCTDGYHKPSDAILDMKIKYITTHDDKIIIEAGK